MEIVDDSFMKGGKVSEFEIVIIDDNDIWFSFYCFFYEDGTIYFAFTMTQLCPSTGKDFVLNVIWNSLA